MHVHFIAVAGTGMGALAGLFKELGHDVSGSDIRFDPPMGPALRDWGIRLMEGFRPENLKPTPDLVVIGNVCRSNNVEARAAIDGGMKYTDMAHALADFVLERTSPVVIGGTHGKTTTTSMCAWLLHDGGMEPGFLIGGLPKNFDHSFHVPGKRGTSLLKSSSAGRVRRTPFVVEGDEYDTAFFEKTPKFWHYRPEIAVITSLEHDHIDIYPSFESYRNAFIRFVQTVPEHGLIVACASSEQVVSVVKEHARCEVVWYGLQGDDLHGCQPHWLGALTAVESDRQGFELFVGGVASGQFSMGMTGAHNVSNALAAMAVAVQGFGVPLQRVRDSLRRYAGVRRRQDLLGTPSGVWVYDDFAHHPTAVDETLRGLRARHKEGELYAVFEPRSATACRAIHQEAYVDAFSSATHVVIAPVGRDNIPDADKLDVGWIVQRLQQQGKWACNPPNIETIVEELASRVQPGDTIVLLSNGAFGAIQERLLGALKNES